LVIVAGVIRHWNDNYKIEGATKLYKAYNN